MRKLFTLLITLMLFSTVPDAQDQKAIKSDDAVIIYDDGLEESALSAIRIYPDIKIDLEKMTGLEISFIPAIYLVVDHEEFQRMSGHHLIVAYAVPEKMVIVTDYSRILSEHLSISSILKHELCHLLLHKCIGSRNLPKWLDEGISQWASGGIADIIMTHHSPLDSAIFTGRQIPFKYLSQEFPGDDEGLMLAYALSKSIVEYMVNEYGHDGIRRLLMSLKEGDDFESAVFMTFHVSFDELEKNWYSDVRKKATWLTILISHLYEIVFFLAAVSLIVAYIRMAKRKRAEKCDDEDEKDQQGSI